MHADSGQTWTDGPTGGPTGATIVANISAPPIDCTFTTYGPAFNCSELTWSVGGLSSILPLRDGKTVLLFGVAHNGDLGMMSAADRTYVYSYAKDTRGAPQPRPRIGISFALKSTDRGTTFSENMIGLDGPFTKQREL